VGCDSVTETDCYLSLGFTELGSIEDDGMEFEPLIWRITNESRYAVRLAQYA
jgi:hypothetical protein